MTGTNFSRPLSLNDQQDNYMWVGALSRLETAVMCRQQAPQSNDARFERIGRKRPFVPSPIGTPQPTMAK